MNGMDARAFFDDLRETRDKMVGRIYSVEEVEMISKGVLVREKESENSDHWLRNALLKKWCEDNGVKIKEENEMTKTMEKMVGRIYEELSKWCAERNVVYEYNFSTDEGESCTFITPDTTLTVNHVEDRDPEQFSKYVKSVLFGVDDIIVDNLKELVTELDDKVFDLANQIGQLEEEIDSKDAYISSLEKEDKEKAKDIEYLEGKVNNLNKVIDDRNAYIEELKNENIGLKYQLDIMNTKILELNDTVSERDKNLSTAADKIVQLSCANATLKGNIDLLRNSLNKEREGHDEINELYEERCKAFINMCNNYDLEIAKRKKAENELSELKAGRHDDTVDVTRYLVVLGKKKRAEENIRSLKSQVEICEAVVKNLADQNEAFKKQVDALVKEKLELDNSVKDMWATVRSLKKENAGLKDANNFLNIKLEKRDEIIEALKNDNDKAEAKIEELLEKNYDLDNHVKNLVAQVEILEREKGEITNELNNVVDNYDKSAISLKKELLKKDDEIRALKQDIIDLNDKKNNIIDKLNDESRRLVLEKKKSSAFEQEIDRLLGLCKDKPCVVDVNSMHPFIGIDLSLGEVMKDVKERITKLENCSIYTDNMLTGICNRLDKIEKPSEIELNLREVKKDIKEKQELIDALNDLDQRITWMEA